jgi:hypothetical protein
MIATMTIAAIRLLLIRGWSAYAINQPHSLSRDRPELAEPTTQHNRSGSIDVSTYHRQGTVLYRFGGWDAILLWLFPYHRETG